jgi:hypothetical protein
MGRSVERVKIAVGLLQVYVPFEGRLFIALCNIHFSNNTQFYPTAAAC